MATVALLPGWTGFAVAADRDDRRDAGWRGGQHDDEDDRGGVLGSDKPLPKDGPAPKVILISLDGAQPSRIERYLAEEVLPDDGGLGFLRKHGARAVRNITAEPSLTAVGHIAMATGSTAVHNDIPSNTFQAVAGSVRSSISGFAAPIGGYDLSPVGVAEELTAEPLWVRLRAAGKKVVTATFPGSDGADIMINVSTTATPNNIVVQPAVPTRTVDYTVPFGAFGGLSARGFAKTAADFVPNATVAAQLAAAGLKSYSPVRVATVETVFCASTTASTCGTDQGNPSVRDLRYDIVAAVLDTKNDRKTSYDTLVFLAANLPVPTTVPQAPATGPAIVGEGRSAPFFFDGSGNKVGAAYYAAQIDGDLAHVLFARYGANFIPRNAPAIAAVDDINNNVGFWRPQPDFRIPERLSAGFEPFSDEQLEALYEDQVTTWTRYQIKVALRAIDQHPDADLVMLYFEQPDGSKHQFMLTDPRQASNPRDASSIGTPNNPPGASGQDPAKIARYDRYIKYAYQRADLSVRSVIEKVGIQGDRPRSNVLVVSDHGFAPFHTAVSVNNLLAAALQSGGFSPSLINTSIAVRTSGPAAHFYVNLAGREAGGTVTPSTYQALVTAVANYLKTATDPNGRFNTSLSQSRLFDKVAVRPFSCPQSADVGLCWTSDIGQDSGDIFAVLAEGYNFDGTQTPGVARLGDPAYNAAATILSVPNFYGAHGYDPNLPDMSATFYAGGPDIRKGVVPVAHNIDLAPTITQLLGVAAAPTVDGAALTGILK
jgi:predicted AlkP superfamily pyrophosphatase or phosphodiesterase